MSKPRIRTWGSKEREPLLPSQPRPLRRLYERDLPEPEPVKEQVEPPKVTESTGGVYVESPPPRPRQDVGLSTISFTASHEEAKRIHAIYERSPGKMTFSRWLRAVVIATLKIPAS